MPITVEVVTPVHSSDTDMYKDVMAALDGLKFGVAQYRTRNTSIGQVCDAIADYLIDADISDVKARISALDYLPGTIRVAPFSVRNQ